MLTCSKCGQFIAYSSQSHVCHPVATPASAPAPTTAKLPDRENRVLTDAERIELVAMALCPQPWNCCNTGEEMRWKSKAKGLLTAEVSEREPPENIYGRIRPDVLENLIRGAMHRAGYASAGGQSDRLVNDLKGRLLNYLSQALSAYSTEGKEDRT